MHHHAKAQTLLSEAITQQQSGNISKAAALYANIRKTTPACFEAWCFGGAAALQLNNPAEAVTLLKRAVQINPHAAMAHMFLGTAHLQTGARDEAEKHLLQATALSPKDAGSWLQLAQCRLVAGDAEKTEQAFQQSLKLDPRSADAWTGLGVLRQMQARAADAIDCHSRALAINPGHPTAQAARAQAWQVVGQSAKALADYAAHLARQPSDLSSLSQRLLLLHYFPEFSREQLFAEHIAFGNLLRRSTPKPPSIKPSDPAKKLRVAFLSGDLRCHSVAFFLEPLLQHLDKTQFDILLYHNHPAVDNVSNRLRSHAVLWRNFVGQGDQSVEAAIRADAPDALFDLSGHTGFNHLPLFARRLAPLQITCLGYPDTTGLDTMDCRFTDGHADPVGQSELFATEKLVRFSSCAWTYQPPGDIPLPVRPSPAPDRPVNFGCFNNLSKLNTSTLRLWARLLDAVPNSRLVLKTIGLSPALFTENLLAAGLDPKRVDMLPPAPGVLEHLRCYEKVDIALDPFPYHGTTTTCEALWMGAPVITLAGDRHASRVGISLLHAVNHPELIAANPDEYIAIAKNLAHAPARLSMLHQNLRAEMESSPLMDHAGQAARFGQAIRQCWQNLCEGAR